MRVIVGSSSIGGPWELVVPRGETVDGLRTRLGRQLHVHTDTIVLLHKDKQLSPGKLVEQGVADGSRLTLQVPGAVQAASFQAASFFSRARVERMVEVLERLTECEISDFLCGRSPLAMKLALGVHTMHVQLQLSAEDVAKLQPDKALSSPPPKVTTGPPSALGRSPIDTSASWPASSPPLASAGSVPSGPRAVSSTERQVTSHHVPLLTPSFHSARPLVATTPVCLDDCVAAPQSPSPAATFTESCQSSTAEPIKQPGAVIESVVWRSQGAFSGTFSGSLTPCSGSGVSRRRRGIGIILQILDDLLGAASHHQGALTWLFCPAADPPAQEHKCKQRAEPVSEAPAEEAYHFDSKSEENHTLHCKRKRLQSLMAQRRHHRQARRPSQFPQAAQPDQRHHRT